MPNPVVVDKPWQVAPAVTPRVSTLLDHADITENIEYLSERGIVDSYNCLDMAVPTELCPTPTEPKEFEGVNWLEGIRFAVYGGVTCKPFGFDDAKGLSEIERVFAAKESLGVERALMDTRFQLGPDDDPGAGVDSRWPAATDIHSAGAVTPKAALALLEEYAASIYAGVPTIHAPVSIASLLASENALVVQAGKAYSHLGSKVVAGAGYAYPNHSPTGTDPAADQRWVYATGEVLVARSPIQSTAVTDTVNNDVYAIAERIYIAAVDCFAVGIRVKVE